MNMLLSRAATCGRLAALLAVGSIVVLSGTAHADRPKATDGAPPAGGVPHWTAVGGQTGWSDADASVPVSSADPAWGDRDAPVTIVEFADFQCPFSARVQATITQVKNEYGPHKVRIVWKNLPLAFHPNAKPAAEAAQGVFVLAGRDAFWRFHATAFAQQQSLSDASYERWAQEAGVGDLNRFRAALAAHLFAPKVDQDAALAHTINANGTPAFFINGVYLSGAQPIDRFKDLIDQELTKANARIATGTPRARVYAVMSQDNKARHLGAQPQQQAERADTTTVFKIPATGPARGPRTALVTIVQFADFQCPFCAKAEATLTALRAKYANDLRIVWKNEPLPFHARAEPAAELALEARAQRGDAGFWDAHDRLFAAQPNGLDDAGLDAIATAMSLDLTRVHSAIADHRFKREIDEDMELSDDFQASGTPHFFVNGRRIVGAQPQPEFEKIIDEELAKARALVVRGTPPADVYDLLTKDGKGPPPLEKKTVAAAPNAPFKGNANARVTIQVFSEFQCPYCSRVNPTLDEVMKTYGTRVKLVWRNVPLPMHSNAPLAAEAAMEAFKQRGSPGFWAMHDKIFGNQQDLSRGALDGYAQSMNLNIARWDAALDGSAHQALIDADAQAAKDAGITGAPSFVINGYFISGAQPFAKFKKVIDRALAEVRP